MTNPETVNFAIRDALSEEYPAVAELCGAAYAEMASQMSPADREHQLARVRDVERRARDGAVLVAVAGVNLAGSISYMLSRFAPRR